MEFHLTSQILLMLLFSTGTIAFQLTCVNKHCVIEYMRIEISKATTINFTNLNLDYTTAEALTVKNSHMTAIPRFILTNMHNLEEFNAAQCHIELISVFTAENQEFLVRLKRLNLDQNRIGHLGSGAFAGAKELLTLVLSKNHITIVDKSAFAELSKLEELHLSSNNLITLDWSAIADATSLRLLYLAYNQLTSMENISDQPSKLSFLDIRDSNLEAIPGIEKLISMQNLKLSGNKDLKVNLSLALANMTELEELHMGLISESETDFNQFPVLPKLTFISMDHRNLDKIDGYEVARQKFPQLTAIEIGHNKFSCSYLEAMSGKLKPMGIKLLAQYQRQATKEKTVDGIFCVDEQPSSPITVDSDYDDFDDQIEEDVKNLKLGEPKISYLKDQKRIDDYMNSTKAAIDQVITSVRSLTTQEETKRSNHELTVLMTSIDQSVSSLYSLVVVLICVVPMLTLVIAGGWMIFMARRRHSGQHGGSVRFFNNGNL